MKCKECKFYKELTKGEKLQKGFDPDIICNGRCSFEDHTWICGGNQDKCDDFIQGEVK